MQRRAYFTCCAVWPEVRATLTSPEIPFRTYGTAQIPVETTISLMVGDLQRIWLYGAKGYQVVDEVPNAILDVGEELVRRGYHRHLVPDQPFRPK